MTQVTFLDNATINVVALDGEIFTLKPFLPVPRENQQDIAKSLTFYFNECFSDDKMAMVYDVLMKMMANVGFSFSYVGSDRSEERKRIGARIRQLREEKGIEAKQLAIMADIDAANLSRIEKGKYSVGFDILTKIANALNVKVDLV
ncbi:helix-turn-helix domain-containing protein [Marinifilum sp.]|uniref:helix-turn-helix domain-containing protein n=1 Tax=Marinifilum sp. TaxID=2033137 RepID=UPI003BAB05EB